VPLDDAYELAYREAVRALDHQYAAVSELRGRASMLLAAASITLSLPGGEALDRAEPLGWLALGSFVLLGLCMLAIIWPRSEWGFDIDPHDLLARHLARDDRTTTALTWDLIVRLARTRRANARRLCLVARVFRAGACLLAIQMVSTVVAASGILGS
jgi:hypothetical protein